MLVTDSFMNFNSCTCGFRSHSQKGFVIFHTTCADISYMLDRKKKKQNKISLTNSNFNHNLWHMELRFSVSLQQPWIGSINSKFVLSEFRVYIRQVEVESLL